MIKIIMILAATLNLFANIEIKQNMKALYKNVELSEAQENYIFDNQEIHKRILKQILKKRISNYKTLDEKNIVRFTIKPNGEISKIIFLKESGNIRLDRETKRAVRIAAEKFPRPVEETEIRFIIEYEKNDINKNRVYYSNSSKNTNRWPNLKRGTTRFKYNSREYVREFEVLEDGFVNIKNNACANMQLLTEKNQRVSVGYAPWNLNGAVNKGNYKLLIQTKKECDIHVQYP